MKKQFLYLVTIICLFGSSLAESKYVLVQSELNVRSHPSIGSSVLGRLFTGDKVHVVNTYRDWCYLEDLPSEEGHGWVSSQYVVDDPVTQLLEVPAVICANGRVAIRDSVNGKRKSWAQPGDTVYVLGTSDSWSVTDRGYIKTEYLLFK